MGDAPLEKGGSQDAHQAPLIAKGHSTMSPPAQSPTALSPPAAQPLGETPSNAFVSQFDLTQSPGNRQSSFSMNAVATALPHIGYSAPYGPGAPPQQGPYSGVNSAMLAQAMPPQYGIHGMPAPGPPYYPQQGPPMQQYYPMPMYHGHPPPDPLQGRQNMVYAQNQLPPNMQPHAPPGPPPFHYYPTSPSFANPGRPQPQMANRPGPTPQKQVDPRTAPPPIVTGSSGRGMGYVDARSPNPNTNAEELGTVDSNQAVVRGPPRKPKQRGHAIWIGNLPPHTDLMNLVNHICKETPGLDSLFLISKSNCAFANFKDEQTCNAAQQKLHDSRFQTVRLVSRLRKNTVERSGVLTPVGESPASASSSAPASDGPVGDGDVEDSKGSSTPASSSAKSNIHSGSDSVQGKERYFILKSLTIEDLETSVRNGIWATQSHNEELLNAAFKSADSVYLIFSANKSGEYFGYARMTSHVNEDPDAAIEFAPAAQSLNALDLPKAIPTDVTPFAPRGRIIDDSARGTIFWEVERDGDDSGAEDKTDGESLPEGVPDSMPDGEGESESSPPKSWGKPFKLEWISASRVPFYRTRGLRNPWNANREVKIARDGTELEPNVGRRLVGLFNMTQGTGFTPPATVRPGVGGVMGYPPGQHGRPYH